MRRLNWSSGLVRLYALWAGGWISFWFLYVPLSTVVTHPDSWAAGGRVLSDMASPAPLLALFVYLLIPIAGYLVVRLLLVVGRWIARGFTSPRP